MAKILGYNKIYKLQYKADCPHCGAIILFEPNEISDQLQYNQYEYSVGICPSCNSKVSFDKTKAETHETLANEDYLNSGWPDDISNCKRDCIKCNAKCMYRKQDPDWSLFDEFGRLKDNYVGSKG